MGISPIRGCATNYDAPAPNPDPSRYKILKRSNYEHATLLMVKYLDCTNYEGVKLLVFKGTLIVPAGTPLDPHFSESEQSPVARFAPTELGWALAHDACSRMVWHI